MKLMLLSKRQLSRRLGALVALTATLSACNTLTPSPGAATPWQDEVIYFALTDRFSNGDSGNDNGPNRDAGDVADKTNPLGWHGGDFKGITDKINSGYFKALGVTALWVSPVVLQVPAIPVNDGPNKGKLFAGYHGYWAEDFKAVDPHFGSLAEFKTLIAAAHANHLKIVQDIVVNHAGYGASLTKLHPEWFHTDAECAAAANTRTDCPLAGLPDFKQDLPAVTTFLNDFVRYWRNTTAIDGLRIDTMQHVPDSYWQQFFAAGGAGDASQIWSVGEVFNGDPTFLANYMKLGSPSVFDFPLYFAITDQLSSAGGNLNAVGDVFAKDGAYPDASRLTTFVDNHDVTRFVTQVTNKGGSAEEAQQRLNLALSLIYTVRGTPSIYQGTEDALPGKGDPYNYPLGEGNREDMPFPAMPLLESRLATLSKARQDYPALRRGQQQELYRSAGVYAYRRVMDSPKGGAPVVVVINNGNAPVDLSTLGGGIALLGTFSGPIKEITGQTSSLSVAGDKLVGSVPARSALIVSGQAGSGGGAVTVNPALPEVAGLSARAGDGAVGLSWTPSPDTTVAGYRVYATPAGGQESQLNFAPVAASLGKFVARGLQNGVAYTFRVVTVDAQGQESVGVKASATPSTSATTPVTFTVDARSQGNGPIELRRFDTGSQISYPMSQAARGIWKTTIDLPLFRDITFKFGNTNKQAKNSGYEGPNQDNRSFNTGESSSYSGTYDFISVPVPSAAVEGKVTGAGQPLGDALINASGPGADAGLNYALSFADGSFTVLTSPGTRQLAVSAAGFTAASQAVTAPAQNVIVDLPKIPVAGDTKYKIDGDLADWTAAPVKLSSPSAGVFGDSNNWLTLQADSDAKYLYLAYTYKVDNNKAILYLDVKPNGLTKADALDAWKQAATFSAAQPDFFLARYGNQAPELRQVVSDTTTSVVGSGSYLAASSGNLPDQTVEVAIPWTALGLSGKPAGGVNLYGGIFGGDGYGAGDIVPDAGSTPPGANTIGSDAESRKATFSVPLKLP